MRERANEILEADGHPPIAHLTPHTLRHTFASILGVCRVDTRRAVALLGHTDAPMTMGVYAQLLLKLGDGNVELLEQLMGYRRRGPMLRGAYCITEGQRPWSGATAGGRPPRGASDPKDAGLWGPWP